MQNQDGDRMARTVGIGLQDFLRVSAEMEEYEASLALQQLSMYLYRYYNLIVSDEYRDGVE